MKNQYLKIIALNGIYFCLFLLCSSVYAAPKVHEIEIKSFQFTTKEIRIKKGDIVKWINNDIVPHNVSDAAERWESPGIAPKNTFSLIILETMPYLCSFHPTMKAKIVVEE